MNNGNCPACGERKQQNGHFVCRECYNSYQAEAAEALAGASTVITLRAWVHPKAAARLAELQQQLEKKQAEYAALQEQTKSEAYQAITETLKGQRVDHQVFCRALKTKAKELWKDRGGNRLHYELRTLESQVAVLKGTVKGLEDNSNKQGQDEPYEDEPDDASLAEESSANA